MLVHSLERWFHLREKGNSSNGHQGGHVVVSAARGGWRGHWESIRRIKRKTWRAHGASRRYVFWLWWAPPSTAIPSLLNFTVGPPFFPSPSRLFFPQFFLFNILLSLSLSLSQPLIPTPTSPQKDLCRISAGKICGELPLWFDDIYGIIPSSRLHFF